MSETKTLSQIRLLRSEGQFAKADRLEEQIVKELKTATIVKNLGNLGAGAANPFLLELASGIKGVWKPQMPNISSLVTADEAAYRISDRLGFHLVPPTVLRKWDGKEGVFQLFVEGTQRPAPDYNHSNELTSFDYISRNYDRKPDNLLMLPVKPPGDGTPFLEEVAIDHGWALRTGGGLEYMQRATKLFGIKNQFNRFFDPAKEPERFQISKILVENLEWADQNPAEFGRIFSGLGISASAQKTLIGRIKSILDVQEPFLKDWQLYRIASEKHPVTILARDEANRPHLIVSDGTTGRSKNIAFETFSDFHAKPQKWVLLSKVLKSDPFLIGYPANTEVKFLVDTVTYKDKRIEKALQDGADSEDGIASVKWLQERAGLADSLMPYLIDNLLASKQIEIFLDR